MKRSSYSKSAYHWIEQGSRSQFPDMPEMVSIAFWDLNDFWHNKACETPKKQRAVAIKQKFLSVFGRGYWSFFFPLIALYQSGHFVRFKIFL